MRNTLYPYSQINPTIIYLPATQHRPKLLEAAKSTTVALLNGNF